MSDILIKNVEMPKNCEECPFFDDIYTRMDDDDTYRCDLIGGLSYWQYAGKAEKDCPLIELPPHGRLIDADVVEKEIERYEKISGYPVGEEPKEFTGDDGWETVRYTAWMARFFIAEQNAPTIIPADEDGAD